MPCVVVADVPALPEALELVVALVLALPEWPPPFPELPWLELPPPVADPPPLECPLVVAEVAVAAEGVVAAPVSMSRKTSRSDWACPPPCFIPMPLEPPLPPLLSPPLLSPLSLWPLSIWSARSVLEPP